MRAYHLRFAGTTCHGACAVRGALEDGLVGLHVLRPQLALVDVAGVVLPVLVGAVEPLA